MRTSASGSAPSPTTPRSPRPPFGRARVLVWSHPVAAESSDTARISEAITLLPDSATVGDEAFDIRLSPETHFLLLSLLSERGGSVPQADCLGEGRDDTCRRDVQHSPRVVTAGQRPAVTPGQQLRQGG